MTSDISRDDILKYAIENGIINLPNIEAELNMKSRRELLEKHEFKIWQGKDNKWYTYLPDEEKGRILKKRNTKESIQDCVIEYYEKKKNEPTMKEVFNMWITQKLESKEIEKQTYDRYNTDFTRFFESCGMDKRKMKYITEDDLEVFIKSSIADKNLSNKAYSGMRTIILGMYKYAKKKGYTTISITQFMGDLELSKKAFKKTIKTDEESVFTDDEVDKIVDFINHEHSLINLGILLALQTGIRVGELSALTFSDVKDRILRIDKTEIRYRDANNKYVFEVRQSAKTDAGNRDVILSDKAMNTIRRIRLMNPNGYYMFEKNGTRIKEHAFSVKICKICKYVNILPRSIHKARKTYATQLINANVDEKIITSQMGHIDISCTKNFYYYNNKNKEQMLEQINRAYSG